MPESAASETLGIVREKLLFENPGVVRTDGLSQRVAHGTFEARIVLYGNQVGMILSQAAAAVGNAPRY